MSNPADVTRLLQQLSTRPEAADELMPLVYASLQKIARGRLRNERATHTLQPTALVHEAYVRLVGSPPGSWKDSQHFLQVASEAMRRVLIDHARKHRSQKRGSGRRALQLDDLDLAARDNADEILALDEALATLEDEDERAARVVKLRVFAGLTMNEVVEALEISPRTAAREWAFARARLYELMGYEGEDD